MKGLIPSGGAGTRLRLSVQVIDGETGVTHWSDRFDDEIDDVFDVQDRIAAKVTGHIAPHLRNAEIARAHRISKELVTRAILCRPSGRAAETN